MVIDIFMNIYIFVHLNIYINIYILLSIKFELNNTSSFLFIDIPQYLFIFHIPIQLFW